jgi:hypothetical protein
MAVRIAIFIFLGQGAQVLCAQESVPEPSVEAPSVLHIQQSQTTSLTAVQNGDFPQFIAMYHVLDGAKSTAEAEALTGTLSLKNDSPNFSEVLWLLAYWKGTCPVNDQSLTGANFLWSDILKNPSQSESKFSVNLSFPHPLPMTGCGGLVFAGSSLFEGKVTMSADLDLTYRSVSSNTNTVIDLSGEYCFGQDGGCQNATAIDGEGFAVPVSLLTGGHLVELIGNISDSTFDGTPNFGPLPTGNWGAENDFYLLPGGCGIFTQNLNSQGFPNPAPLATLHSWLPHDALHLESVPLVDRVPSGGTDKATLQRQVENIFSVPVLVHAGDCIVVIYGRKGNGATDNETQVHAVLTP